ncbi:hypothetical protein DXG01_001698 [Tephrocybe rancida]|nr:hypothetical protein DXG01_001698 [Tephrocybe rancida]
MISARLSIPMARPFGGVVKAPLPVIHNNLYGEDTLTLKNPPWQPFHLTIPKDAVAPVWIDFGEFLQEPITYRQPQRVWPARPKFGAIADYRNGEETSWPPRLDAYANENSSVPIAAPIPMIPLGHVRVAFEVRASAAVLTKADFTPQSATFDQAHDENMPPCLSTFDDKADDENAPVGPLIPAPNARGMRKPFALLHYDEASKAKVVSKPASPLVSESGSDASPGSAKGWARLRPKAPPAIKTSSSADMGMGRMVAKPSKGKSFALGLARDAPVMTSISPPQISSPHRGSGESVADLQ